jgi:hypothetical protein
MISRWRLLDGNKRRAGPCTTLHVWIREAAAVCKLLEATRAQDADLVAFAPHGGLGGPARRAALLRRRRDRVLLQVVLVLGIAVLVTCDLMMLGDSIQARAVPRYSTSLLDQGLIAVSPVTRHLS